MKAALSNLCGKVNCSFHRLEILRLQKRDSSVASTSSSALKVERGRSNSKKKE